MGSNGRDIGDGEHGGGAALFGGTKLCGSVPGGQAELLIELDDAEHNAQLLASSERLEWL